MQQSSLFSPDVVTIPETFAQWRDPNPTPVIEPLVHDPQTLIVRDDLLAGGTKRRALDYLIGHHPDYAHIEEWVYGSSPAHGYAQVALSLVCRTYHKRAVLFMADREASTRHPLQHAGLLAGGDYRWVPNGMLSVTEKRARDYVAESPTTRHLVPMGGNTPEALASLVAVMSQPPFTEWPAPETWHIWSVISSGTLSRALQAAFPQSVVHGVVVGHQPTPEQAGRALLYQSPYPFRTRIKTTEAPPYPSAAEYDAKLWPFFTEWRRQHPETPALIWNVGA